VTTTTTGELVDVGERAADDNVFFVVILVTSVSLSDAAAVAPAAPAGEAGATPFLTGRAVAAAVLAFVVDVGAAVAVALVLVIAFTERARVAAGEGTALGIAIVPLVNDTADTAATAATAAVLSLPASNN
jgi:hypothetical protein